MDIPLPEIKDVYECRFCEWEHLLKSHDKTKQYLNTIKNHLKKKHNMTLKTYEVVRLVQKNSVNQ